MDFMAQAARCAREGMERGHGGPFGAVIVRDGQVVGAACNRVLVTNDPTAHAEIEAIRAASRSLARYDLSGCEIYATSEPCPMCLAAIYWARIDKVYYALPRAEAAHLGFRDTVEPRVECVQVECEAAATLFADWSGPCY